MKRIYSGILGCFPSETPRIALLRRACSPRRVGNYCSQVASTLWFNWEQHAWKNVCGEKKTAAAFAVSVCAVRRFGSAKSLSSARLSPLGGPAAENRQRVCVASRLRCEMCREVRARWPLSSHSNEVIILSLVASRRRRFSLEFFALVRRFTKKNLWREIARKQNKKVKGLMRCNVRVSGYRKSVAKTGAADN